MRHVLPLSSERHTPDFFGSSGVGVGDATGLALGDGDGLGLGAGPPGVGSSPPVPALAPTSICARITFESDRETPSPIRPSRPSGKPLPSSFFQVLPASIVFQMPLPGPPPLKPKLVRRR